jgi:hypothetical protein
MAALPSTPNLISLPLAMVRVDPTSFEATLQRDVRETVLLMAFIMMQE